MKTYLGDGVYVELDGFGISLTTENGYEVTNTIHIEPDVYENLIHFVNYTMKEEKKEE